MTKPHQLPLSLSPSDHLSFSRFFSGPNQQIVDQLQQMVGQDNLIYLWGNRHIGKSHLLQAACLFTHKQNKTAIYIPLALSQHMSPEVLHDLSHLDLVCLDDIQSIAGKDDWETAIFNLFNQLRHQQKSLLISANQNTTHLPLQLADLTSRLSWGTQYQIQELSDADKANVILKEAKRRGMILSKDSADYLLNHFSRDLSDLSSFTERLDKQSLSDKRKPTLTYIRQLIKNSQT